jgi:hypothetical protein
LLRQEVEARITAKTVEIFHRGNLVATHLRSHSWPGKSAQFDKWNFCLKAARIAAEQEQR